MTLPTDNTALDKIRPSFDWSGFYDSMGRPRRAPTACQTYLIEASSVRAEMDTKPLVANLAVALSLRGLKTLHLGWAWLWEASGLYNFPAPAGLELLAERYAQKSALTADDLQTTVTELGPLHHVLGWARPISERKERMDWPDTLRGDRQVNFIADLMELLRAQYDVVLIDAGVHVAQPLLSEYLRQLADRHILSADKELSRTSSPEENKLFHPENWVVEHMVAEVKPLVVLHLKPPYAKATAAEQADAIRREAWWVDFPPFVTDRHLHDLGFADLATNTWWISLQAAPADSALRKVDWVLMPPGHALDSSLIMNGVRVPVLVASQLGMELDETSRLMAHCYEWIAETHIVRR